MSRALPEWIGANDDTALPARVKVRLFDAAGKCCQKCGRPLRGADKPEYDHIVALINGGQNRESNIQVLCAWCHKPKTKLDVAEKSRVTRKRQKFLGIKRPRTIRSWRRFDGSIVHAGRER